MGFSCEINLTDFTKERILFIYAVLEKNFISDFVSFSLLKEIKLFFIAISRLLLFISIELFVINEN